MSSSNADWDERFVEGIASEIRRLRTLQGMSAQVLADKINERGHFMSRSTLADIENGRRKYITVTELIVLARALSAAPVALMFPGPYDNTSSEILPGVTGGQFQAVQWFSGEGVAPEAGIVGDAVEYEGNCRPLDAARQIQEMELQKWVLEEALRDALANGDEGGAEMNRWMIASLYRRIAQLKEEID